jgi:chromosome segregation ATPase
VVPRAVEEYRKYDAVDQAVKTLEDVMYDTEERRQGLRKQIDQALRELQKATTIAETQKLQGLLSALNAELGAVDRERDTALSRVIVQGIYNQTDAARQQQARREDTEASVRQATDKLAENLKVDTSPIRIPSPALR